MNSLEFYPKLELVKLYIRIPGLRPKIYIENGIIEIQKKEVKKNRTSIIQTKQLNLVKYTSYLYQIHVFFSYTPFKMEWICCIFRSSEHK